MKKYFGLFFVVIILSAFGLRFYDGSPNVPVIDTSALSPRQLELINQPPPPKNTKIDKLIVHKGKREMHAFYGDTLIKIYPISLGKNPIGHKEFEGDMKTPEGTYTINERSANSGYHKNLGISYPNDEDIKHAQSHGKSAGGAIKIHGIKNGLGDIIGANHLLKDWTHGCIAVTNEEIDELFIAVVDHATIEILP